MTQVLKLEFDQEDQDWIGLRFSHNDRFLSYIQYNIKPASYRRWNPDKKRWDIHKRKLLVAVSMGKRFFDHVDYGSLPEELQILIVKHIKYHAGEFAGLHRSLEDEDPYRTLHLLPSAPWEVIQAAYKALAFLFHPDRGGDQDQFRNVDRAYQQLKKIRESQVVSNA